MFVFLGLFLAIYQPAYCDFTIDLTWPFDNETLYWNGITPFYYTKIVGNTDKGYWYAMNEFCTGEHGGTHFDAPYHFNKEGWKMGDVPISRLIAKGALLESPETLQPRDLDEWVAKNGQFEENTVLLVKFNYSRFWPNKKRYMALDENGNMNFPGLSSEAANWIARNGRIVGVGVDTASVDAGASSDFMVHRVLSKRQIYGLENVKLVEPLPVRGFTLIVAPMKLKDGTGGPVRILAVSKNKIRPKTEGLGNSVGSCNYEANSGIITSFVFAPYVYLLL